MQLTLLGLSHRTAPINVREQVAVARDSLESTLTELRQVAGFREAMVISTCNRTEFYVVGSCGNSSGLAGWLAERSGMAPQALADASYSLHDEEAVFHLCRVACGLDSLVLGEPQILGQIKTAYRESVAGAGAGPLLNPLMQHVFSIAKRVRTDTDIGRHSVSVASTVLLLAQQIFGDLTKQTVMLLGAGEMIELTLRHLSDKGIKKLLVVNRSLSAAELLAEQYQAEAIALTDIHDHLARADIIISSTGARQILLSSADIDSALNQRRRRPIFAVDIAVPRDIDPEAARLSDFYLYSIDDLQQVIQNNTSQRFKAASTAEDIIRSECETFCREWRSRTIHGQLRQLVNNAEQTGAGLKQQALNRLTSGEDAERVLDEFQYRLTRRILHQPLTGLRRAATDDRQDIITAARHLFGLEEEE